MGSRGEAGRVIYELEGVPEDVAREAFGFADTSFRFPPSF